MIRFIPSIILLAACAPRMHAPELVTPALDGLEVVVSTVEAIAPTPWAHVATPWAHASNVIANPVLIDNNADDLGR